jgi:membrane protein
MAAIRTALNIAWDTDQRRPFVRGKAVDLLLVLAAVLAVGAALGATILSSLARQGSEHLPGPLSSLSSAAGVLLTLASLLAALLVLFGTFLFLFRVVPAVPTRVREIWPGAAVAAVGFLALQFGFSVYVAHFADYNRVYGSLGAVVAFLFFVYLASAVFLLGAEVAAEYPRLDEPAGGTASAVGADALDRAGVQPQRGNADQAAEAQDAGDGRT